MNRWYSLDSTLCDGMCVVHSANELSGLPWEAVKHIAWFSRYAFRLSWQETSSCACTYVLSKMLQADELGTILQKRGEQTILRDVTTSGACVPLTTVVNGDDTECMSHGRGKLSIGFWRETRDGSPCIHHVAHVFDPVHRCSEMPWEAVTSTLRLSRRGTMRSGWGFCPRIHADAIWDKSTVEHEHGHDNGTCRHSILKCSPLFGGKCVYTSYCFYIQDAVGWLAYRLQCKKHPQTRINKQSLRSNRVYLVWMRKDGDKFVLGFYNTW